MKLVKNIGKNNWKQQRKRIGSRDIWFHLFWNSPGNYLSNTSWILKENWIEFFNRGDSRFSNINKNFPFIMQKDFYHGVGRWYFIQKFILELNSYFKGAAEQLMVIGCDGWNYLMSSIAHLKRYCWRDCFAHFMPINPFITCRIEYGLTASPNVHCHYQLSHPFTKSVIPECQALWVTTITGYCRAY